MSKNNNNKKDDVFDYDAENDSFFVYSKGMKYKSSIDLGDIILDIAEDNSIMGLEILSISNKLGISKYDVKHFRSVEAVMEVSPEVIKLRISMHILKRNAEISRMTTASTINSMNLPVGSESLAVTA